MNQSGFIRNSIFIILVLVAILIGGLVWFRSKQVPAAGMVPEQAYTFECPVPSPDDKSAVLVTMDGVPLMTVAMFEKEYNTLLEKNPQAKMLAQFMPDLKAQFFEGLLASKIVDRCVIEKGLSACPEYQQEFAELLEAVKQQLNKKYFGEQIPVSVTTEQARALYEEQKDKAPEILISQGGIATQGIEFSEEQKAQDFLSTLLKSRESLEKLAEKEHLTNVYRDFKLIHQASLGIDQALKDAVLALTKFPSNFVVKAGDSYWVISATAQEDKKYRPFAELEEMIKETIKKQKQDELEREQIEMLKGEYNVDDSMARAYFEKEVQTQAFNETLDQTQDFDDQQDDTVDRQITAATRAA